jgi:hypothetical protein
VTCGCPPGRRYAPFVVPLSFGARLEYDGIGLLYVPGSPPEDGVYGDVTVKGGAVAGARPAPVPSYTPAPCVPAPDPCGDPGGGGAEPSAQAGNLLALDPFGRLLVRLFAEGAGGVEVTGDGTYQSPLRITAASQGGEAPALRSDTPDVLEAAGLGTQAAPWRLSHRARQGVAGSRAGLVLDGYGHVTGFSETSAPQGVTMIQAAPGTVEVTVSNGAAVVGLPAKFVREMTVQADDSVLTFDLYGRATRIDPYVPVADGAWSRTFQGPRTAFEAAFQTARSGRIRVSYSGDLNLAVASGRGLAALPSSVQVTVAGEPVEALARLDGLQVIGFEAVTAFAYAAGPYSVTVTLPAQVTAPGLMDVRLCL